MSYHAFIIFLFHLVDARDAYLLPMKRTLGMQRFLWLFSSILFVVTPSNAQDTERVQLRHLSTYHTGIFGSGAAEISAFDPDSKRLFFVNATHNSLEVLDVADPEQPQWLFEILMDQYGGGVNSVVAWDGYVAVALEAPIKQDAGSVAIFDTNGQWINQVQVGALPDMIAISPDHSLLMTANEGEPNDTYTVDPEGSISIIDLTSGVQSLSQNNVITLGFEAFNFHRASFETQDQWPISPAPAAFNDGSSSWGISAEGNGRNAPQGDFFWKGTNVNTTGTEWNNVFTLSTEPYYLENLPKRHVEFYFYAENWSADDTFSYIVHYDDGTEWDFQQEVELAPTAQWTKVRIPLESSANVVRIQLRILRTVNSGDVGIDDLRISYLDESTRIFGNNALQTVAQDLEPEYIAFHADGSKAWVSLQENNALVEVDVLNQRIIDIRGLGFKDWSQSALDASDQDGQIRIVAQPVKGMYQPDAISSALINGEQYIFSANEGDARAYGGFNEEVRLSSRNLDATVFPNGTALKNNANAGRLRVSSAMGDYDFDGDYDELFAYGARSFSIWNTSSQLVFDSGSDFETKVAEVNASQFNANNDDNTSFDSRSDDKGPEPEAITTAWIEGRCYAFVGLERVGGIMVYDVTNPQSPIFVQYINNRDFAVTEGLPGAGDLGPEGILFISKDKSPNERNLIVLSSEISGTVSIFQIDIDRTADAEIGLEVASWNDPNTIGSWNGTPLYEGGFSGLYPVPGTVNEYYTVTDRGPNADATNHPLADGNTLFFPIPNYQPTIVRMVQNNTEWTFGSSLGLQNPDGIPVSGIPLPAGLGGTGEVAWSSLNGDLILPNVWGIDAEGITLGNDGFFWVCDEYGSSIWKIHPNTGEVVKRYTPFPTEGQDLPLDSAIGFRRPNRGFEGITWAPNGKIYAVLQSPASFPTLQSTVNSRIHRIVELDPWTEQWRYYTVAHKSAIGEIREQDWKIGDLVAVNDHEFLAIEHAQRNGWNYKNIIKIDISNATPLTEQTFGGLTVEQIGSAEALQDAGINPAERSLFLDLLEAGWNVDLEKPEGLAVLNDSTIAVCNDNDFGIAAPDGDGSITETETPSQLWVYSLPNALHLEFVSPICNFSIEAPSVACANEAVIASVTQPVQEIEWSTGETSLSLETLEEEISVRVVTDNGCVAIAQTAIERLDVPSISLDLEPVYCATDSIEVALNTEWDYAWSNGAEGNNLVFETNQWSPGSVELGVIITDPTTECSNQQSFSFTVEANPVSSLLDTYEGCEGDVVTVEVENELNNILWSTGSSENGISFMESDSAWVELVSANGCVTRDSLVVFFRELPADALPTDTLLCRNTEWLVDLSHLSSVEWSDGSTAFVRELTAPSNWSVVLTSEFGCSTTEDILLQSTPVDPVHLGEDFELCFGTDSTLTQQSFDTYLWSDGSTLSTYLVNATSTVQLTATDEFGCVSSDAIEVLVRNELEIPLADSLEFCEGESIVLNAGSFDNYLWSNGATSSSIEIDEAGVYAVTVGSNGCSDSSSVVVEEVICIGIRDFSHDVGITLFPNPVHQLLHIVSEKEMMCVRIFDQRGALIVEENGNFKNWSIDTESWFGGIYTVYVLSHAHEQSFQRIVKL
jgi:hypothetical protein